MDEVAAKELYQSTGDFAIAARNFFIVVDETAKKAEILEGAVLELQRTVNRLLAKGSTEA